MNKRLKNRLWLVTCLALAIITTYTIYRYYCVHRIGDSDFYWHIMLGKNAISGLSADDSLVWPNSIYQTSYTNYSLLSDIILYKLSCIREDETFGALVYMLITAFITSFIVFAGWGRNVIKKISSSARSTITSISAILFSVWLLYMAKGNPRPHLMALACFVVSIGILESRKPNVSYLAIPLAVIWANLHGASMPLLIVMELLYLIDVRYISPFQQSYPSHIPLGACYGTDDLFGSLSYASPYLAASSTCIAAWTVSLYFAGSSDRNGHAHHGYFMDHRHISWLHESTFCRLYRASYDLTFVIYRMSEFMVDIAIYRIVSSPAISCGA